MRKFGFLILLFLAIAAFLGFCVRWVPADDAAPPPRRAEGDRQAPASGRTDGGERQAPAPAAVGALVIPVEGVPLMALVDSWGDGREEGARAHQAIDIPAPRGTPVVAASAGTVEKLFTSDRGGLTVYIRTVDGQWMHYYAHLDSYADGLAEGQRVAAGQVIGQVGDSGNAGEGNTHLHFAVSRLKAGDRWWQGEPVNPYPLLARAASAR